MDDRIRVLRFAQATPRHDSYINDERYLDHLCAVAGNALGAEIIRNAAVHTTREDERERVDQWDVAVVTEKKSTASFAKQLDEARRQGMRDAADIVARKAARYSPSQGPCGHVIQGALEDVARVIHVAAAER